MESGATIDREAVCGFSQTDCHADDRTLSALSIALRRYFRRHVPAQDSEDMVQDVLLSLHGRRGAAIQNLQGYVFVVAANLLRQRRRTPQPILFGVCDVPEIPFEITPERIVIDRDGLQRVMAAIEIMPARTRQIFLLHRFEDMTYPAIASGLGISVSAVEKHIIAALKTVRAVLGGER